MKIFTIIIMGFSSAMAVSCVSSNKYAACQKNNTRLETRNREMTENEKKNQDLLWADESTIKSLRERSMTEKKDSSQKQAEVNNLSELSNLEQEDMNKKNAYIRQLITYVDHKDSFNNSLVANLKNACGDNTNIKIRTEKGAVYVDIADDLLFKSGKYDVTDKARGILAKIAVVLQNEPQIKFTLEGHTDNVPFNDGGILLDNWDLSVKRATSVVRILQKEYHISPTRMSAAGYGEYAPTESNNTKEGMAENRTTRIVILPQMDEFYTAFQVPKNK